MKSLAWLVLMIVSGSSSYAGEINARLSVPERIYGPGNEVGFDITYTNVSNRTVRFIPENVVFPADLFVVTQANRGQPIKPKHYGFLSLDFEGQARNIKTLKPGGKCEDRVTAHVMTRLPDYFHDGTQGLFLVFPASAFRLPRAGEYVFTVVYRASKDEPARFYAHDGPPIWAGEAHSNPVAMTFRY